jgi:hypothetical protein
MIAEVGAASSERGQSKSSEDVLDYVHYISSVKKVISRDRG